MPTEAGNTSNVWAMDESTPSDSSSPSLGNLVRSGSKRMLNAIAPKDNGSLRRDIVKNKPAPGASASADAAPFGNRQNSFLGALSPRKPKAAQGSRAFESIHVSATTSPHANNTAGMSGLVGGSEAAGIGKVKQTLAELVRQKRAEKEEREKAVRSSGSPDNLQGGSEFDKADSEAPAPIDFWNVPGAGAPTKRFSLLK